MSENVVRLYPEAKTALIKWIEDNFDSISAFTAVFQLDNETSQTIYSVNSTTEALGLLAMGQVVLAPLIRDGTLKVNKK